MSRKSSTSSRLLILRSRARPSQKLWFTGSANPLAVMVIVYQPAGIGRLPDDNPYHTTLSVSPIPVYWTAESPICSLKAAVQRADLLKVPKIFNGLTFASMSFPENVGALFHCRGRFGLGSLRSSHRSVKTPEISEAPNHARNWSKYISLCSVSSPAGSKAFPKKSAPGV